MFNYIRYAIAIFLFSLFFFNQTITINEETVTNAISKKFPKTIDKKGFTVVLNKFEINEVYENVIDSTIYGTINMNDQNVLSKMLKKEKPAGIFSKLFNKKPEYLINKKIILEVNSKTTPIIKNNHLVFKVESLKVNKVLNIEKMKGFVKKFIQSIKFPIKKLEQYSFIAEAKDVHYNNNGDIDIAVAVKPFILFLLIPLFLLREIGLLLIAFYQKILSPKKGYKCAKGVLHGEGTCSSCTKDAFKEKGFVAGMKEYRKSTKECRIAYKTLKEDKKSKSGWCDGCAGCDGAPLVFGKRSGAEGAGFSFGDCASGGFVVDSCDGIGSC